MASLLFIVKALQEHSVNLPEYPEIHYLTKTMKRDHLVIYDNTNSYTFWLGDIRGVETKERFETTQDLIDYLTTCFKTIKTTEII